MIIRQREYIRKLLEEYLNGNHTVSQIYDIIVDTLNVPRPTVRREARSLRIKYQKRLDILSENKREKITAKEPSDQEEKKW